MKRDASKVIWRTVVVAGAMLGAPACGTKTKQANTTPPSNTAQTQAKPAGDPAMTPTNPTAQGSAATPDPNTADGNPCGADRGRRARAGRDEGDGGGMGRGFILS